VVWSGSISVSFKYTSLLKNPSNGTTKFANNTVPTTGTMDIIVQGAFPAQIKVWLPGDVLFMDFWSLTFLKTRSEKSKTDQFLLVGAGDCYISDGATLKGPAYLDVKGTVKKDASGNATSINMNGKVTGGGNPEVILTGTLKATFTK
jgi:hypothetical protein